jgi:hypothetical protein
MPPSRFALRVGLAMTLTCGAVMATPGTGHALFHLMRIREVFTGTSTAPDAHFIELQMYAENQRFVAGHEVAVFDASGNEVMAFTFTSPMANGANQSYILLATVQAEQEFDVSADLIITPVIPRGGGKVCFRSADGGLIDCAAWGGYSGEDTGTGTPFNAPLGLVPDQSMERDISGGSDPETLDEEDDTDDSEADFDFAAPTPTNNEGTSATAHERSVTLKLKGELTAQGKVGAEDDFVACFQDVTVKFQRKDGRRWETVKRTTTDSEGAYEVTTRDRPGKYRAMAPETSPSEEDRCLKATSPVRRN